MSKKNKGGGDFQNRAARKFKDSNRIDLIGQEEIFEILEEDFGTILKQIDEAKRHVPGAKYPTYTGNMFANLSVPLYIYCYVRDNVKVKNGKLKTSLEKYEIEAIRQLLADAYKKSMSHQYDKQAQDMDDRNRLILKAFAHISPKLKKAAKKLKLNKHMTRVVMIQVYGDPKYNMKQLHKQFNNSTVSDKKKMKILKKLYGSRFEAALGAALTVNVAGSDILATIFDYVKNMPKKKRGRVIRWYAEAYKLNGTTYHQFTKDFAKKNKKIVRELKLIDIGYKKAFKYLQSEGTRNKDKKNSPPFNPDNHKKKNNPVKKKDRFNKFDLDKRDTSENRNKSPEDE